MIFCGCSYCAERRTSSFARKTLKRWRYRRNADLSQMRRNPYSQEDRDKVIAECRDTGLSYRAIALKTGVSRETVSRWCREAGYPRQRGRNGVPQVKRQKILFLYKNTDLNFSQIARHPDVELPRTTVRDIIKFQDVTKNPVHESRLTGLLTMAIWPTDDINEANNAKRLALNILNNAIADDIDELKLIFRKVIGQAGSHLGAYEKLEAIWEEATTELTISYRELLGEREKKPAKKKAKKKKPTKKKTTYRRTRRSGVCILCGEDSRGKPYCRRHYYEFIGREYYETCQVPDCDNPSFGQPKCREHYYGGRRRTRRRRPRRPPRRNPKYRRNVDESLRKLEREAAAGGRKGAYYRQLMRTGQPIPSVVKAHQKLIKAIRNFPMARASEITRRRREDLPVPRYTRRRITKKPFLRHPKQTIEYILPSDGEDKENIDASLLGQTPIAILLDSLEQVIDRTHVLIEPDRPVGGPAVIPGLLDVHFGNYTAVLTAARNLAKAAAELRFMFIDGEKNAIWGMATALLLEVIALSSHATGLVSGPRRIVKSLEGRINEFSKRIISKSRISHITGEITELAVNLMYGSAPDTAIRLRVINRRWIYLISPLLMIAKKFK